MTDQPKPRGPLTDNEKMAGCFLVGTVYDLDSSLRSALAEVAELKRYKVAALSELLEFRSKIEIAQLALETEEKRCGRLYGTLGHALTTIRGGQ